MMAYRPSVHEFIGYTPQFLVHGHEVSQPLDLIFPNPNKGKTDVRNSNDQRKQSFQQEFELFREYLKKARDAKMRSTRGK